MVRQKRGWRDSRKVLMKYLHSIILFLALTGFANADDSKPTLFYAYFDG